MTLSFVPSQHDAFNDGVAIALARVVRSQLSPAGGEHAMTLFVLLSYSSASVSLIRIT